MTTTMILIPLERSLEDKTTDTPSVTPVVEYKLLQQAKNMRSRVDPDVKKREISIKHMSEHEHNLNYDKNTGEIQYDGVNAVGH